MIYYSRYIIKRILETPREEARYYERLKEAFKACMISVLINLIFWTVFAVASHAEQIPENQAVRAIIGEAGNQGYQGMLAVACAIRNRGTLQGVYGLKAKHVDREPKWVWDMARRAWYASKKCDVTNGSTNWENVNTFGRPYWVKNMTLAYVCGDHNFYRRNK